MQHVTEYIKLRVLAAIDLAEGRSIRERIRAVSARPFLDEQGREHRFTWRTIDVPGLIEVVGNRRFWPDS